MILLDIYLWGLGIVWILSSIYSGYTFVRDFRSGYFDNLKQVRSAFSLVIWPPLGFAMFWPIFLVCGVISIIGTFVDNVTQRLLDRYKRPRT